LLRPRGGGKPICRPKPAKSRQTGKVPRAKINFGGLSVNQELQKSNNRIMVFPWCEVQEIRFSGGCSPTQFWLGWNSESQARGISALSSDIP
jgi:hypothetical protein